MQQHVDCTSFDSQLTVIKDYLGHCQAPSPGENAVKAGSIEKRVEERDRERGGGGYFALEAALKWRALHLLQGAG